MFGYILVNKEELSQEELARYRGCYCGLCRALKMRYGQISRLSLNFDMTFLILLLTAMYEPEEESGSFRCGIHPLRSHPYWHSRYTDYAADLTVALAYFNCLDDWKDDRSLAGLAGAKTLEKASRTSLSRWPRQGKAIESGLAELERIENTSGASPDAASDCFGRLLGELFVCEEDRWADSFRAFGQELGRFVYMLDACVDEERDRKKGSYNPLFLIDGGSLSAERKEDILKMLMGACVSEFEKLPVVQDTGILRNILYSGVWTRFNEKCIGREDKERKKNGRRTADGQRPL